jgi:hypothetical protein
MFGFELFSKFRNESSEIICLMRLGFGLRPLHIGPPSYLSLHLRCTSTMTSVVNKTAHPFDKGRLEALLNRRFFYAPAFEIYGG